MNEIANFCEKAGADVDMVRIGIGSDNRIGKRFLFAGIGYGGSCFPKDIEALAKASHENNYDFQILKAVMAVNEKQKKVLIIKIKEYFHNNLVGKKIAVWGLAFKPDTDDIREAPSLTIIGELLKEKAEITAFDPEATDNVRKKIGEKISYAKNQYDALEGTEALVIATEWSVFRTPDFEKMSKLMKSKVIFDGRNLYDIYQMEKLGFYYNSMGRETVKPVGNRL